MYTFYMTQMHFFGKVCINIMKINIINISILSIYGVRKGVV